MTELPSTDKRDRPASQPKLSFRERLQMTSQVAAIIGAVCAFVGASAGIIIATIQWENRQEQRARKPVNVMVAMAPAMAFDAQSQFREPTSSERMSQMIAMGNSQEAERNDMQDIQDRLQEQLNQEHMNQQTIE